MEGLYVEGREQISRHGTVSTKATNIPLRGEPEQAILVPVRCSGIGCQVFLLQLYDVYTKFNGPFLSIQIVRFIDKTLQR